MTTKSSKPTPGPWRAEQASPNPTPVQWLIAGGKPGCYLAEIRDSGLGDPEADARLIAAAPELLEKLKLLVEAVEYHCRIVDWPFDALDAARAAIAKAEGEAK